MNLGITDFPVLADGSETFKALTPMTQEVHPEMCALTPDMKILSCYSGHGSGVEAALQDIRDHAGI